MSDSDWYFNFMIDQAKCEAESSRISGKLLERGYIHTSPLNAHCFRVPLAGSYQLSISVPADANSGSAVPLVAETALVRHGSLVYVGKWGYDDVCRFCGTNSASDDSVINELCSEIDRLKVLVTPSNQDDEDDDDDDDNDDENDEEDEADEADEAVVAQGAEQVQMVSISNQEQDG